MNGFLRNLRYWSMHQQTGILFIAIYMVGFSLFMQLFFGEDQVDELMPLILLMFTFVFVCATFFGSHTQMALCVSLGSLRKHCYIAMQISNHLMIPESLIIILAFSYFYSRNDLYLSLKPIVPSLLGIFLILAGVSNLFEYANAKGKRTATGFGLLIAMALAVCMAVILEINFEKEGLLPFVTPILQSPLLPILGIGLDAFAIFMYYSAFKKCDIQFS